MKTHLISGGCGFVGRNMVQRLYKNTTDRILFIDNLYSLDIKKNIDIIAIAAVLLNPM